MDLGRRRAPALRAAGRARRTAGRTSRAAGLALAALFALSSPAGATTVTVDGSVVRIAAASGESNRLSVGAAADSSFVTVTDAGAALAAGAGCLAGDGGVTCMTPEDPAIDIRAGDRDDSVTVAAAVPAFVDAGSGNDVVDVGGGVSDSVWCGAGRDAIVAETLDFLDRGCERVDYGRPGVVGRIAARGRVAGGSGRVPVPGQTWALVDRRILPDVLYLIRRYRVRIAEGFGTIGHSHFGEHPLGLAVDIEPGAGGTWNDVSRLARWAEPRQNRPRRPFRWVGWNGDYNHGHPSVCKRSRGCPPHLHLSWAHTPAAPRRIAGTVWVFDVLGLAP